MAALSSPPSPLRIAFAQKLKQRPGGLDFAPGRPVRARLRVPGVDIEMRPRPGLLDKAPQKERRRDRARHSGARARIAEVSDRAVYHRLVGTPQRHAPERIAGAARVPGD